MCVLTALFLSGTCAGEQQAGEEDMQSDDNGAEQTADRRACERVAFRPEPVGKKAAQVLVGDALANGVRLAEPGHGGSPPGRATIGCSIGRRGWSRTG